ncbi:nucleopolyhedrovirus P10 family protein [Streptomyces sp. NPDC002790]|uniref:nucleopolyhedrovirus P10 family protein n=1 Tax=Streptomyces sp. NPDC002790 TaxID=3154431 RepID=UPI003318C18A
MTADRWTEAVRTQLGLGRLLPLGGPQDGAWLAEPAAAQALRRAVQGLSGVRLGALRLGLADPDTAAEPAVPAPPSALPAGPLRLTAECAATADEPLPVAADRLREALAGAAEWVGLVVSEVDLQVTALLDEADRVADADGDRDTGSLEEPPGPGDSKPASSGDAGRAAEAALAVPGVARLTGALGGLGRAVHIEERAGEGALPRRHVRVEVAVAVGVRPIEVTGAVRRAVAKALPDGPTVAVLVTEITA